MSRFYGFVFSQIYGFASKRTSGMAIRCKDVKAVSSFSGFLPSRISVQTTMRFRASPASPEGAVVLRIEPPAASRPLRASIADAYALCLPHQTSLALDGSAALMATDPIGQSAQHGARRTAVNPRPAPASPVLGV